MAHTIFQLIGTFFWLGLTYGLLWVFGNFETSQELFARPIANLTLNDVFTAIGPWVTLFAVLAWRLYLHIFYTEEVALAYWSDVIRKVQRKKNQRDS